MTTHSEGEEPNRRVVIMLANQPERAAQEGKSEKAAKAEQGDKPSSSRRRRSRRGRRGPKNAQNAAQENVTSEQVAASEPVDVLGE